MQRTIYRSVFCSSLELKPKASAYSVRVGDSTKGRCKEGAINRTITKRRMTTAYHFQNRGVTSQTIFKMTDAVPDSFRQSDGIEAQKSSNNIIAIQDMTPDGGRRA